MPDIQSYPTITPSADDWLIVQTALGATSKYAAETLLNSLGATDAYGDIYQTDTTAGTPLSVGTAYVGWKTAAVGEVAGGTHVTADVAHVTADQLIIGADGAGKHKVEWSAGFTGSINTTFTIAVFVNGAETRVANVRGFGTSSQPGAISATAILDLPVGATVDLRVKASAAGKSWTPFRVNLNIVRFKA